jgi:serine/threonine-protein kinase
MIGQIVGSYKVVRKLGEGGMGAVYEAVQEQIGRHVAIKVLLAGAATNAQIAQRFFNEARAVNLIDHPSLVEIFDMGHLPDGTAFIVMELLKGESLTDRIRNTPGGLGLAALRTTRQIASALAAAHEKQIVHRDLKPDNVFLVADPEAPGGERAKVLDFGIAKMAAELQSGPLKTSTQMLMGTPAYMAPEQCRSSTNVNDKADVYSLGIILFQMLSGRLPFDGSDTMQLLYAHVHEPPPSLGSVVEGAPAELVAAVDAMLAKDADARPTMAEVVATMARLGGTVTGHAIATPAAASASTISRPAGEVARRTQVLRRPRTAIFFGASVAVAIAAVLLVALVRPGRDARAPAATASAPASDAPSSGGAPSGGAAPASASATARATPPGPVPRGEPHCGRFKHFLVPTPPGFSVMSCSDSHEMASLVFTGKGSSSAACAPMKLWAKSLDWDVDFDTTVSGTEAVVLHHEREQLTVACASNTSMTVVSVSLVPVS